MRLEYLDLVDEVTELHAEAGRIAARSRLPLESPVFEGHFPGCPLVPGTLMTEILAQAGGLLVLARESFERLPVLMAIDRARFRTYLGPGAEIDIGVALDGQGSGYVAATGEIRSDGRLAASAALRYRLTDEFPAVLEIMRARARQSGLLAAP